MATWALCCKRAPTNPKNCCARPAGWWPAGSVSMRQTWLARRFVNPRRRDSFKMPKILLVEDNEMNRDMLSRRLQRKGYEVVIAVDGGEGVALAHSQLP